MDPEAIQNFFFIIAVILQYVNCYVYTAERKKNPPEKNEKRKSKTSILYFTV